MDTLRVARVAVMLALGALLAVMLALDLPPAVLLGELALALVGIWAAWPGPAGKQPAALQERPAPPVLEAQPVLDPEPEGEVPPVVLGEEPEEVPVEPLARRLARAQQARLEQAAREREEQEQARAAARALRRERGASRAARAARRAGRPA